ncbi:MAG: hypothetical protein Q9217_000857, partial [Psora testacea]
DGTLSAQRAPTVESFTPQKSPLLMNRPVSQSSAAPSAKVHTPSRDPQPEKELIRYIDIHKRFKDLRKLITAEAKRNNALKDKMGDMRRAIKKYGSRKNPTWVVERRERLSLCQRHYERMTGLGSGFAALSHRKYEKSKLQNLHPDYHYWQAPARIANIPIEEITQTHFVFLKGMVENYEGKFIGFYGGAAVAALRVCVVELPARLPQEKRGGLRSRGLRRRWRRSERMSSWFCKGWKIFRCCGSSRGRILPD